MTETKKLKVEVVAGKNLAPKNGGLYSNPYCIVMILNEQGGRVCKDKKTKAIKKNLNPQWNARFEFNVPPNFAGMKVSVWDKHRIRADKFMGQLTLKFNPELLRSEERIDEWFVLNKRPEKPTEAVSGSIHLRIQYGDEIKEIPKGSSSNTNLSSPNKSNNKLNEKKLSESSSSSKSDENKPKPHENLKLSKHWNAQDKKLGQTAYVVIDEGVPVPNRMREGPPVVHLDKLENSKASLSNNKLELTNTSSNVLEGAIANVKLTSGKWYYEVKILSYGQYQIGWCGSNYKKVGDRSCWLYTSSGQKVSGLESVPYGSSFSINDTIGCLLDLDGGTISFSRNGESQGIAFEHIAIKKDEINWFSPLILLNRNARAIVNFGATNFQNLPETCFPLHLKLTDDGVKKLLALFDKYKAAGSEDEKGAPSSEEIADAIQGKGTLKYAEDLGIDPQQDYTLILIAWKLKAAAVWTFSRDEWLVGWGVYGCTSLEEMKRLCAKWKDDLRQNISEWKKFYRFVFDYLKEDKRILPIEDAVLVWNILFKERPWKLYKKWRVFVQQSTKAINSDVWNLLLDFAQEYPEDLSNFDPLGSWPSLVDEFVEWMKEHKDDPDDNGTIDKQKQ